MIVQSADPKANAQYQGAVAFQLARPTPLKPSARKKAPFVVVRFKLELPSSDRYVVGPGLVPSTWNLERTRAALAGVRLVGSMPPARMTVATRASRVSGAVVDRLGHSVGGAFVTVYRVCPAGAQVGQADVLDGQARADERARVHARGPGKRSPRRLSHRGAARGERGLTTAPPTRRRLTRGTSVAPRARARRARGRLFGLTPSGRAR